MKRDQFGFDDFTDSNLLGDERPLEMIQHEFVELGWIFKSQCSLAGSNGTGPTWHAQVWSRILYCAIDLQVEPRTSWGSVATARIEKNYLPFVGRPGDEAGDLTPRTKARMTVTSKVDYAVTIIPTPAAQQAISSVIDTRCEARLPATISHASGLGLRYQPIAISIVGCDGKQDSTSRLGIWSAAWFKSTEPLFSRSSSTDETAPLEWIPLISIDGKNWTMLFAINDVESGRVIVTELPGYLGNTWTIVRAYMLLASLRVLLRWADGKYRARWDKMLEVAAST